MSSVEIADWAQADGRPVAVYAQYPDMPDAVPLPVVVLCHGLGGDHRGFATLGAHLASHGYAVLHPEFLDSRWISSATLGVGELNETTWVEDERLRAVMMTLLFDPEHWLSRVARVHAVLDSLSDHQLPVRLRPDQVTIVGHSYGAYTAQLILGTRLSGVGLDDSVFTHRAVCGGVLMSPQGSGDRGLVKTSWDDLHLPFLVVTATNDIGAHGEGLAWRREPYDAAPSRPKYLAVARGEDHFLGGANRSADEQDQVRSPEVVAALAALCVAFVDSVNGDGAAGGWLASGPYPSLFAMESAVN